MAANPKHEPRDPVAVIDIDDLRRWSLTRARLITGGLIASAPAGLGLAFLVEGDFDKMRVILIWSCLIGVGIFYLWSARRGLFPGYRLTDVPRIRRQVPLYAKPFADIRREVIAAISADSIATDPLACARVTDFATAAELRRQARKSFLIVAAVAVWFCIPMALAFGGMFGFGAPGDAVNSWLKDLMAAGNERFGGEWGDILVFVMMLFGMILGPIALGVWHWEGVRQYLRQAKSLEQPNADALLATDQRPATLFLRSFRDDTLELPSLQSLRGLGHGKSIRFEEAFASLFGEIGPLIAIGEPGESLPKIGAAKTYFSDDEWQDAVLGWMQRCRLIVLAVGPTPAVTWELSQILRNGHLTKLILVVPPGRRVPYWKFWLRRTVREDREARVRLLLDSFSGTPWAPDVHSIDWDRTIVAHTHADGRFVAIAARRPVDVDYQMAFVLAFYGMLLAPLREP